VTQAGERAAVLARLGLREEPIPLLDALTASTGPQLRAPVCLFNIIGGRQYFAGLYQDIPIGAAVAAEPIDRQMPLTSGGHHLGYCVEALDRQGRALPIADTLAHPRWALNPATQVVGVRAYLGVAVTLPAGSGDPLPVATFCVIDTRPHDWTPTDVATIKRRAAEGAHILTRHLNSLPEPPQTTDLLRANPRNSRYND
jgi:GAF domain-containing protein